jgi:hypothetical protein
MQIKVIQIKFKHNLFILNNGFDKICIEKRIKIKIQVKSCQFDQKIGHRLQIGSLFFEIRFYLGFLKLISEK